jgi:hypothetical protein
MPVTTHVLRAIALALIMLIVIGVGCDDGARPFGLPTPDGGGSDRTALDAAARDAAGDAVTDGADGELTKPAADAAAGEPREDLTCPGAKAIIPCVNSDEFQCTWQGEFPCTTRRDGSVVTCVTENNCYGG